MNNFLGLHYIMFNLNIDSYSLDDLKKLFNVEPSGFVNSLNMHEIIEERYNALVQMIQQSPTMGDGQKQESNAFLFKAKAKLAQLSSPSIHNTVYQDSRQATSLPWQVVGKQNSTMDKKVVKLIGIDSKFRDSGDIQPDTNNFQVSFNNNFNKVESMEIVEYSGPTALKVISESLGNNFLNIDILDGNGDVTTSHVVTIGDYYRIERNVLTPEDNIIFVSNINADISNALGNQDLSFAFPHEYNNGTNMIGHMMNRTLRLNNGRSESVRLNLNQTRTGIDEGSHGIMEKKLGHLLGFRNSTSITVANGAVYDLPAVLDLVSFKYAYLIVDDFQSNGETNIVAEDVYSVPCAQNMKFGGNILAKINYRNETNYNMMNRVISTPRMYYGNVDIAKLRIMLVNEFGDLIDTQQADWSFTLKLDCSYH